MTLHPTILEVTDRIAARSAPTRAAYLTRIREAAALPPRRGQLSCGNLAHGFAACAPGEKANLKAAAKPNIAIVSAYNDMLSAHQPLERFPALLKEAVREAGGIAQFAGGVPAMCDGVTQGQAGMELSLFSRDVIAMATAVALSHDMFDAALYLGVCDKIVPGLLIGALSFGHLPAIFVPAGPMTTGLPNEEKARIRQLHAEGKLGRDALLEAEAQSYHGPGTCTFYGTANSNQLLMEIMGLHLPGTAFVNPGTQLRDALTLAAGGRICALTALGDSFTPIGEVVDERAIVNAVVGLHATGGSTNHTIHLIAIAAAAGLALTWEDFADLSAVAPLLARIYPNGMADVNQFHAAGGIGLLIRELLGAGLLHPDVRTVAGEGLAAYTREPWLQEGKLAWREAPAISGDRTILRPATEPFSADGGLKLLQGNLGRAVIKVSAVKPERYRTLAPAIVFHGQNELLAAFKRGELERDFVAVIRFQGPKANGMPELHKLTPTLAVLQDRGFKVALLTDGRMSGASGKVPAAIHLTPEALGGGPIARVRDGDPIQIDAVAGTIDALVPAAEWEGRPPIEADLAANRSGIGRELFGMFRATVARADAGASVFGGPVAAPALAHAA